MSTGIRRYDRRSDGVSRPSKNNRQAGSEALKPKIHHIDRSNFEDSQPELVPLASRGQALRQEAAYEVTDEGRMLPISEELEVSEDSEVHAKPTAYVLDEWHDWMEGYESAHITFENDEGETVRSGLENSHMEEYEKRYYARLKDLERGINRRFESLTTVMLTFTGSTVSADGFPRPPGDHMLEIREGWRTARKTLHQALSGRDWEYARIWEPHQSGYGHLHVAIFVDGEAEAADFAPVMGSYVRNTKSAGREPHTVENAVSVNDSVENLGSYISEYLGAFKDVKPTERELNERIFRATVWATNTRRLDFSNGAQEIIAGEEFRRETGLRPEDRGEASEGSESVSEVGESGEGSRWRPKHIMYVRGPYNREKTDPTSGGLGLVEISVREGVDLPPDV